MLRSRTTFAAVLAVLMASALGLVTWRTGALAAAATRAVTWSTVASQPYGTLEGSGIEVEGKLYSFGGYDVPRIPSYVPTARSYTYDPVANTWTAIANLPAFNGSGHGGISHAGIATDGTSIYLAGGYPSDVSGNAQGFASRDVYRYSPSANTYTRMPDLPEARGAGGLAFVDGELHYIGGTGTDRAREAPEHWALSLQDPASGWQVRAPMPSPRNHAAITVLAGKVYVSGGGTGQDEKSTSSAVHQVYDPATNAWTTLPSIPKPLSHAVATVFDGQVVVVGGQTSYGQSAASTYGYDPKANTWTAMTPLPASRFSGVVGTIDDTLIYAGGSTAATTWKGTPAPLATTPPTTPSSTPPTATNPTPTSPPTTTPASRPTTLADREASPAGTAAVASPGATAREPGSGTPSPVPVPTLVLLGGKLTVTALPVSLTNAKKGKPGACPRKATVKIWSGKGTVLRRLTVTKGGPTGCLVNGTVRLGNALKTARTVKVGVTGNGLLRRTPTIVRATR